MKKHLIKRFTQFTATLSLCAAVLAGISSDNMITSGTTTNHPNDIFENSSSETSSDDNSDITPQNDRDPNIEIKE